MASLFRWLMRAVVGLAVLAAAGLALAYYLASQSLPDYDRSVTLAGPEQEIEIVRDRHAVPHILSRTDHDAFFGLGFVHAQDRLWQMTLARRTVQGRLAEIFGPEQFERDRQMRALDLYGLAQTAATRQDPETLAALQAYSDGVNAWMRTVQAEALGRGAPEFFLFTQEIAPWLPADSIAVQKLMALTMTDKAALETLRARLSLTLPPERLDDILPTAPNAPLMALPEFSSLFPQAPRPPQRAASRDPLALLPEAGRAGASNAFAAAGKRGAAGRPLLATDPHLALTAPSVWMLARVDLETGPVIGGTIPGIPSVLVGRSGSLAWGLTASHLDDQDIFFERLDPADPERYLTPGGSAAFETREAVIGVKGAEPVRVPLSWSRHGPVMPRDWLGIGAITPSGYVPTLAWTGLSADDGSIRAAIELMRAQTVGEARAATRSHLSPSLNVTLADADTVGMQMAGAAPRRQAASVSRGRTPARGWLPLDDWKGMRPFEEHPWVEDPASGIVVNTNNRITDAAFPDHLSFDWGDATRIVRAGRLLGGRQFHSRDSFVEIQTDAVSEAARVLLPLIARDLWYAGDPSAAEADGRQRQAALERLAAWNGAMSEHDPEPLIYTAWIRHLRKRLVQDELGTEIALLPPPDPVFVERVYRDVDGAGIWCDVVQTTAVETCTEMSRLALDDALRELGESYRPRLESWRWGDAHQAEHRHQTLGSIPMLRQLVNIRQSTAGDDHTLMRGMMAGSGPEPYLNVHASGFRAVVDFSDPDSSLYVIATGQSGHPLSRHYDDLAALWRRGEYIPMALDPAAARAGAVGTTRLLPQGGPAAAALAAASG